MKTDLEIWRAGEWLADAPEIFSRGRIRRKRTVTSALSPNWLQVENQDPERREMWLRLGAQLKDAADRFSASADLGIRRRGEFFRRIYAGELVGLGFTAKSSADDPPSRIPLHLFDESFIEWRKNSIRSEHFDFRQVRVVEVRWLGMDPAATNPSQTPDRLPVSIGRGPKPSGDLLVSIYDELLANQTIQTRHTLKEAHAAVRSEALSRHRAAFPGERGLSYKTFANQVAKARKIKVIL